MLDSLDMYGLKSNPQRNGCRFKTIWIHVDGALIIFYSNFCSVLPTSSFALYYLVFTEKMAYLSGNT